MRDSWVRFIATVGFVGHLRPYPATWMSLFTLIAAWFLNAPAQWILFLIVTIPGFLVCGPARRVLRSKDPNNFVADEASGMLLSLLMVPKTAAFYLAAFLLFRLFDVAKPFFIRSIQNNAHPASIMWDDMAAGLLTNALLQLFIFFKA